MWTRFILLATLTSVAGCFKYVKPVVTVQADPAPGEFPHDIFARAIDGRVSDGLIDYAAIQADRADLDEYLAYIARVSPNSDPDLFPTEDAKLAYWINAYNALAIRGVIDRPGLNSVDDIKIEYFFYTRYKIGGKKLDLYRLENKVVRAQFADPRIHFALNCQSGGCPIFPPEPFMPETLQAELDRESERFVNHPEKVRQKADGTWEVSEIFKWYQEDFAESGGAAGFIHQYRPEVPADAVLTYIPYDWSLIKQPGKGP